MTPLPKGANSKGFTHIFRVYHVLKWEETILLKAREQKDASLVSLFATFPWGGRAPFPRRREGEREREIKRKRKRERER